VTAYCSRSKDVPSPPPQSRLNMLPILRLGALAVSLSVFPPTSPLHAQAARADSIAVTTAVARFHDALTAGDSVRAVALLASDALVLESGAIETRAEYLSHHLGADMAASKDSKGTRTVVQVRVTGDAAYVVSRTVTPPTGDEGSTGSQMAELMVLGRTPTGWTIQAIHWSSRRRRS
jgi:ketosteroid isomerase-like protein